MTQDISSSGVDVDMLVGLKPPTTITNSIRLFGYVAGDDIIQFLQWISLVYVWGNVHTNNKKKSWLVWADNMVDILAFEI